MRRVVLVTLTVSLWLGGPATSRAQFAAGAAAGPSSSAEDQAKPPAAPPGTAGQPPATPATAAQAPAAAAAETTHSLFDQTWHQFQFGARLTNIDGDPARFQRYQDVRDGVLFTDARYANESAEGDWRFRAAAGNVGYRDPRYFSDYERTGRFKGGGRWGENPPVFRVDTPTPPTPTR